MTRSFRAFMERLIDYAGLFPPARLGLDEAVRFYGGYRRGTDAWMLGRFIVPAARLEALRSHDAALFAPSGEAFGLSVILSGADEEEAALGAAQADLAAAAAFEEGMPPGGAVRAFEVRLPKNTARSASPERSRDFLRSLERLANEAGFKGVDLFVETPPFEESGLSGRADQAAAAALADLHAGLDGSDPFCSAGFKLRCGGLDASAFPSVERVARVIAACRDNKVPLKCTAGLHHPLRVYAPEVKAVQHGFVNVFGAALLAHGAALTGEEIRACLLEEDPAAFGFSREAFSWRGRSVSFEEIVKLRWRFVAGFGSCSFDEPLADLRALTWLD